MRFVAAAAAAWMALFGSVAVEAAPYAYVPLASIFRVAVVDVASRSVVDTLQVGGSPVSATVSPDGSRVYVVGQSSARLYVIDSTTRATLAAIPLSASPWVAAVSPDGSRVYVSSFNNAIDVIDAATNTRVATFPNLYGIIGMRVSSDGSRLYASAAGSSAVYSVDTTTGLLSGFTYVGNSPSGLDMSPDQSRLYVANSASNTVSVINRASSSVIATIPVGAQPAGVVVGRDGSRAYVTNSMGNSVSVIDTASLAVIATIPVGIYPYGLAVTLDGGSVFVANRDSASMSVIDTATLDVTTPIGFAAGSNPFAAGQFMGGYTPPEPPRNVTATRGNQQITLSFDAPVSDGGKPVTGYSTTCGASVQSVTTAPVVFSGLANGVAVSCHVNAINSVGMSANSATVSATPATLAAPPQITGVVGGDGFVSVSFTPSLDDGGSPISAYNAFCGPLASSGLTSPIVIHGLENGVPVSCFMNSVNGVSGGYAGEPFAPVTPGVAPEINSAALPSGQFGVPYSHTIIASGAPAPAFSVSAGSLPAGLELDSVSGVVSGTPTAVSSGAVTGSITAINGIGQPSTQAFSIVIAAVVPTAPTIGVATAGNGSVEVAFLPPASDGGSAITSYRATCGSQSSSGLASPIVVSGLANGSPVTCQVVATNIAGDGPPSASGNSVTPATTPDPPEIVSVIGGDGTVTVSFLPGADDGGSPILAYNAHCGSLVASGPTSPLVVNGLENGVSVTCVMNAVNSVGGGEDSAPWAAVTPGVAPAISSAVLPPGQFGVAYVHTIVASGAPAPVFSINAGSLPAGLELDAVSGVVSGTPTAVSSAAIAGSIMASNGVGEPSTQAFSIVIAAVIPTAPTIGVATAGNGSVEVVFLPPASDGGSAITSYRATCGSQSNTGLVSPIVVSGLANGTSVSCDVVAINVAGEGPASATSNSVTPATVPDAPMLVSVVPGDGQASLSFNPPAYDGGSVILDYTARCTPGSFSANGAMSPLQIVGLSNGSSYACSVQANNIVGGGPVSDAITVMPGAPADLSIRIDNDTDFVSAGIPVIYAIDVANAGSANASDARVVVVPDKALHEVVWTCSGDAGTHCPASGSGAIDTLVSLPASTRITFLLGGNIDSTPETPVTTTATVTAPNTIIDTNLGNNAASDGPDTRGLFRSGFDR